MRIRVVEISKKFGPTVAVDNVSLVVEEGELFFLLGPSGCGKTTLLRMIAGQARPSSGQVLFGDRDVTRLACEKRNTAMVFQNYALWPHMTVRRNVEFAPKMKRKTRAEQREIADENLCRVEMADLASRKPNELSGGQQQRAAVARALAAEADCLLLDEPLSNLDARLRTHMRVELRELIKASGTTAIYVTHDQKEALSMADRIGVMNEGKIVQFDTPQALYDHPANRFVADFLGEANFLDGTIVDGGAVVRVRTAVGALTAASPKRVSIGDTLTCCVRPEHVTLRAAGTAPPGQPGLGGTVAACTYLGESRQYLCRLADDTAWKVLELSSPVAPHAVGADVTLHVGPENVILLKE